MIRFLIISLVFASVSVNAFAINYESEGNLQASNPANCGSISTLTNKNSPADIFVGLLKCIEKKQYKNASELYLVAMAYGKYDTLRVSDTSAHQAIVVLRINGLGNLDKKIRQQLQTAVQKTMENTSAMCRSIAELGKPSYHPAYMIQHGMRAFLGQKTKDGLVIDFKPADAWNEVLTNYIKCPKKNT